MMRLKKRLEEKGIWLWSQNLNELPGDRLGPMWKHGRASISFKEGEKQLRFSWCIPSTFWHTYLEMGDEDDVTLSVATPLAAFWLGFDRMLPKRFRKSFEDKYGYEGREIKVSYYEGSLSWSLWHSTMSWDSKTPRWRNGSFNFADAFLGRAKYSEREISKTPVVVPMPEGTYKGTCRVYESTWARARWPKPMRMVRTDIEMETPVPIPGKGENSWDCDEDAIYSLTSPNKTPEDAVGALVTSALKTRQRHGGTNWVPEKKTT